jgi:ABC-type lipoprotein release transport system permease subunit
VVLGLLLGLPAAVFAGKALSGLLYGLDPVDLPALVFCPVLLLGVATLAILLPARRAARFDPATTLRLE